MKKIKYRPMKKMILTSIVGLLIHCNCYAQTCWNDFEDAFALQENSQWCWAAGLEMVLKFNGVQKEQCEIVEDVYNVDACDNSEYSNFPARGMRAVYDYLTKEPFEDEFDGKTEFKARFKYGGLNMMEIIDDIDVCYPIMVEIKQSPFSSGTHLILITGYLYDPYTNTLYLTLVDPYPHSWYSGITMGVNHTTLFQLTSMWVATIYNIESHGADY
jgi:hypothetical protein